MVGILNPLFAGGRQKLQICVPFHLECVGSVFSGCGGFPTLIMALYDSRHSFSHPTGHSEGTCQNSHVVKCHSHASVTRGGQLFPVPLVNHLAVYLLHVPFLGLHGFWFGDYFRLLLGNSDSPAFPPFCFDKYTDSSTALKFSVKLSCFISFRVSSLLWSSDASFLSFLALIQIYLQCCISPASLIAFKNGGVCSLLLVKQLWFFKCIDIL